MKAEDGAGYRVGVMIEPIVVLALWAIACALMMLAWASTGTRKSLSWREKRIVVSSWTLVLTITFSPIFMLMTVLPAGYFVGKSLTYKAMVSAPIMVGCILLWEVGRWWAERYQIKRIGNCIELE